MISRREKLQLFNKLRGAGHAEADLALLEDVNPRHPKLTRFARDPKRYADEILYALLDECDEGDIVDHRIYFEKLNENLNDTSTGEGQEPIDGSSDASTEGGQESADGSSNTSAEEEQILQMAQVILQPKKRLLKVKINRNQNSLMLPTLARTQKKSSSKRRGIS